MTGPRITGVHWLPSRTEPRTGPGPARESLLIRITLSDGLAGAGEIAPLPERGHGTVQDAAAHFAAEVPRLLGQSLAEALSEIPVGIDIPRDAAAGWGVSGPRHAGVELALLDAQARVAGVPLARLLRGDMSPLPDAVPVNAAITSPDPEAAVAAARAALGQGFRAVKLKVAHTDDVPYEAERVRAVAAALGEDVALRLDANGRWAEDTAAAFLDAIAGLAIEYLEEPAPFAGVRDIVAFAAWSPLPVALDETLERPGLLRALLDAGAPVVYVLKPSLIGGLRTAAAAIDAIEHAGRRWVVTSAMDTGVGLLGAAHLVASRRAALPACGLATLDHFARPSLMPVPAVQEGALCLPHDAGLGAGHADFDGRDV